MRDTKILAAEAIGTFILMMGGPGVAVLAAGTGALGGAPVLTVSLGFGFALMIAAYAVGPVSGCHINPAVTLGMALMNKMDRAKVPLYVAGQGIGALAGAAVILIVRKGGTDDFDANASNFATNQWGAGDGFEFFNFGSAVLVEIIMTAILVLVVLSTTRKGFPPAAIGLIHMISIPIDNTSVNPARSLGMAVFAGGEAIEQLWAFIVFPLVGAIVGAGAYFLVADEDDALA